MNEISCHLSESGIAFQLHDKKGISINGMIKAFSFKDKIYLNKDNLIIRDFTFYYFHDHENNYENNLNLIIKFIRYVLTIYECINVRITRCDVYHNMNLFYFVFYTFTGKEINILKLKRIVNKKISIQPLFENILLRYKIPHDLIKIVLEYDPVDICCGKN